MRPMTDISKETLQEANKFLAFLSERAVADWDAVMRETLSSEPAERSGVSELDRAKVTVEGILEARGLERPLGAVVGGTGLAKTHAGLGGEESQRAVQVLKIADRLVQCGKGRGKCLVVISSAEVTLDELPMTAPKRSSLALEDGMVENTNVIGMLKSIRDQWRQRDGLIKELQVRNDELEREVLELRAEAEAARREVREAEARRDNEVPMAWS